MTLLALIRHGETEWNRRGLIQGTTDVPLNKTGIAQAVSAAEQLVGCHAHITWTAVVSSPLMRALDTGQLIANSLAIPLLEPIPELIERDYGAMEGLAVSMAKGLYATGEYPKSELNDQVFERARSAIENLRASHKGQPLIVVTHGGLLHTLLSRIHGVRLPSIENATVNILEYSRIDGWNVRVVNNKSVEE